VKHNWICALAALVSLTVPALAHKASEGKIIPADLADGDHFGFAVAMDGSLALSSAPRQDVLGIDSGSVYVYARTSHDWDEEAKLIPSNGAAGDLFGYSVALSGDTAVVGAPLASGGGSAYVFVRSGTTWSEQAILVPSVLASGDKYGLDVNISGDTIVVGSPNQDTVAADAGAAFVFVRSGTTWTEEAMLTASDGASLDFFGTSVSADADNVLVGSIKADGVAAETGAAYLYKRTGSSWAQDQKITRIDSATGDLFGTSVSIVGDRMAIGAPGHAQAGTNSGAAYMYQENVPGTWTMILKRIGTAAFDKFGASLETASTGYTVVGSAGDDEEASNAGKTLLYTQLPPPNAFEVLLSAEPLAGDQLGVCVALNEHCWAIGGAPGHDDAGVDAGSADIFTLTKPPVHYCTAGVSASGCQATLTAHGVPCATELDGFVIEASNVEGGKDGLFFFSSNGQQAMPWGNSNSFRCVTPPVKRGGLVGGSGTPGLCDGYSAQDLNTRWQQKPKQNPGGGTVIQIQFWYRDPQNTSGQSSSLSDAVQVTLCP